MKLCILSFAAIFFCNYTSANSDSCEIPEEGKHLLTTFPPNLQAKMEIRTGNPKFMGVYGYTLLVPGLSMESSSCLVRKDMVKAISGTSDSPCSEALEMFNYAIALYAEEFNRQLLLQSEELKNHTCFSMKNQKN